MSKHLGSTLAADTYTYTDTNVSQGVTYYYYVIAVYSGGDSPASEVVNGVLLVPMPPPAVSGLALTATTTTLDLNWSDVSGETYYQLYRSTDNNNFTALGGQLAANTTSYSDNSVVGGTTYYYYIVAGNNDGESGNSNTVSGSLLTIPEYASDLIISEYVEGSSYNKAIELANFTGSALDLSDYELGKQTNGSGAWTKLSLSGTLSHGSTYVVAENSAGSSLLALADLSTGSSVMIFNGNDPVALFKNSSIIDIVGTENGGSGMFAENVTMIRNADVTSPNTSYTLAEWTTRGIDDFSDVGAHTMTISGAALPFELLKFTGNGKPGFNLLEWWTESETNTSYFDIEKSEDGSQFHAIGQIDAMGYSTEKRRYEFVENDPEPLAYYRLKQVDKDGSFVYSKIITIRRLELQTNIAVSPVPAIDHVVLHLETAKPHLYNISIHDMAGRVLFTKPFLAENNYNQLIIPLNGFQSGVYILEIKNEIELIQSKFVKVGQ